MVSDGVVDLVVEISRIPYGRPADRSARGVLSEGRGTCSIKHLLLAEIVSERWPGLEPTLWHRVYRVTPDLAAQRWGAEVAAAVPPDGLVDVHTYPTLTIDGRAVRVDATFPLDGWDGSSDVPLACGDGVDHPAGTDPLGSKAALVEQHCDPAVREPFIAALAAVP
ncbi:MAG: hypothetical protein WD271_10450 [Acidimicrobiia bacterium]